MFKDYLRTAYDKFVAQGYESPALRKEIVQIKSLGDDPARQVVLTELTYYDESFVKPATGAFIGGKYHPGARMIGFSYAKGLNPARLPATTEHEMFHAFQHGGPAYVRRGTPFYIDTVNEILDHTAFEGVNWLVEGTAKAAEGLGRDDAAERAATP